MREVILVVDDEPFVLSVVCAILANAGFSVLRAASGDEALTVARAHPGPIRLLVSDVVMPRLSGPELADAFAAVHPETVVLFMAGMPDTPEIVERIHVPGRPFLPKPFTSHTLLDAVAHALAPRPAHAASA